jgi:hypothetical protein
MSVFVNLTDLPFQLRTPQVRDLAWVLLSPPMLAEPPAPQRHPLCASQWASHPGQMADWLRALDRDPSALLIWLEGSSIRRLGLYYERLWQFALNQAPGIELLAANLPIRQQGHTLGELDLLLRDATGIYHLEFAVKFYLGPVDGDGLDPAQWLGPGSEDRLDLKLDHLRRHQLPLSATPQALTELAARGIAEPSARLWLAGYLFFPWPGDCSPPRSAAGLRGTWLYQRDWLVYLANNDTGRWVILPRHAWLAPTGAASVAQIGIDAEPQVLNFYPHPRLLARLVPDTQGYWQEQERVFLMPDFWPKLAPITEPDQALRSTLPPERAR